MNGAALTLTRAQIALMQRALDALQPLNVRGAPRLGFALQRAKPDEPFFFEPAEIRAADELLVHLAASATLRAAFDDQDLSHLKALFAAAAAD